MAHRVLSLLWALTFAPGAPAEVAQSRVLSESLHHYLRVNTHAGSPLVWEYMRRCISQACTLRCPACTGASARRACPSLRQAGIMSRPWWHVQGRTQLACTDRALDHRAGDPAWAVPAGSSGCCDAQRMRVFRARACPAQIKEDDGTMALSVLNSLVEAFVKAPPDAKQAAAAMATLDAEYDLVEVVIASLEARARAPALPALRLLWGAPPSA